jgi:calcineurin-like phosphoesterase family protein
MWFMGHDEKIEATFHRLNGVKHLVIGNHDEDNEAILTLSWASIILHARHRRDADRRG